MQNQRGSDDVSAETTRTNLGVRTRPHPAEDFAYELDEEVADDLARAYSILRHIGLRVESEELRGRYWRSDYAEIPDICAVIRRMAQRLQEESRYRYP